MAAPFEVGQTLLIKEQREGRADRPPSVITVTRVGRKNAYFERYGREEGFNMETRYLLGEFGYSSRVYTDAQWVEKVARDALTFALHRATNGAGWVDKLTNEQIAGLLEIIDPQTETGGE